MTGSSLRAVFDRLSEALFGKRIESAEAPPIWISRIHLGLTSLTGLVALFCIATRRGWLPFQYSPIIETADTFAIPTFLLLILAWRFILEHHQRRAKDRMTPTP